MRYIIPAFFVCHYDTKEEAEQAAGKICCDVNQLLRIAADNDDHILLDEERPIIEVPGAEIDCELPHTAGPKSVWACVIQNEHDTTVTLHASEFYAWKRAWQYCREWWQHEGLGERPSPVTMQEQLEACLEYLEHVNSGTHSEDITVSMVQVP